MAKKIKSKELLSIIEDAMLKVPFATHYELFLRSGVSNEGSIPYLKERIATDLLRYVKPMLKEYLGEDD